MMTRDSEHTDPVELRYGHARRARTPTRPVSFSTWIKRLPAFLQIGIVVTPLGALIAGIWMALDFHKDSFFTALTAAWALPLAWLWALVYRRRMINYPAAIARVTEFYYPEGKLSYATHVRYRYMYEDREYTGEHTVLDATGIDIGGAIWVLVCPTKPSWSMGWL